MAHLSHNKSIFYKVAVEQIHSLHFCDSVQSANLWLQGQLAQTGHMHTVNTDQRDEPHANCLLLPILDKQLNHILELFGKVQGENNAKAFPNNTGK